jgi:serine/threonine-protein kinase HipA
MIIKSLAISLGKRRVGILFQYGTSQEQIINRFVADDLFASERLTPTISLSMIADNSEEQEALWKSVTADVFNGRYSLRNRALLPPFFQGLLPEGVFRDHIASLRKCDPKDHFEMLAACGRDLPGNIYAEPVKLSKNEMAHLVTQDVDSLEMSVVEQPMLEGVSVSGVQPKISVIKEGERYVGRTKRKDSHIIAKLPVIGYPFMPELEFLSLSLAKAAGVHVCQTELVPLEKLIAEHGYDLGEFGEKTNFLAVSRFDRSPGKRIHVEDFAQILAISPEDKYSSSYLEIAAIMLAESTMGEPAVHELLRRIAVNEMLGNPDMHLKNIGVIYTDGITPELSPAYDIVGYSAFSRGKGHALAIVDAETDLTLKANQEKPQLTPAIVREFCSRLGLPEKPVATVLRQVVVNAVATWPDMIKSSGLTLRQKENLLANFEQHHMVKSIRKRIMPRRPISE